MDFFTALKERRNKQFKTVYKAGPSQIALFFAGMAVLAWVVVLLFSGSSVFAWGYYTLQPGTSSKLSSILATMRFSSRNQAKDSQGMALGQPELKLPPVNENLPAGEWLEIPSVGVKTQIGEAAFAEYEKVLKKGVWRVPELGSPLAQDQPMVLVAHRYGYLAWTDSYRRQNSFYNLPKLKPGDEIRVNWEQRTFVYRVTKVEEGEDIKDYSGDLVLYTCKFLVSPLKYFVYADLVQ
jgi:sortase (surface protein transpeptidase)